MAITTLPTMEHTFTLKEKGNKTGQVFDGTFVYKRPNIRMQSETARTEAMLNGGLSNLDLDTKALHKILATLRHTLIEFPPWWEEEDFGYEMYDVNVLLSMYEECVKFEKEYDKKTKRHTSAPTADSKKTTKKEQ